MAPKKPVMPGSGSIHCATRMLFWVAPPAMYCTCGRGTGAGDREGEGEGVEGTGGVNKRHTLLVVLVESRVEGVGRGMLPRSHVADDPRS